jgi:ABC-type multidrug transport system fused ATPase/permease subunit
MLSLGDYVAMGVAASGARGLVFGLSEATGKMLENALYIQDLASFLSLPTPTNSLQKATFPNPMKTGIWLDRVSFKYPSAGEPSVLDVSLRIKPGEKVAIVGENGAGKTTLAKCLVGLYYPTSGMVRVDNIPITEIDPNDLYRHITVIFQDFVRYYTNARENIGYGNIERLDDSEGIFDSAISAGADEIIRKLPNGLETGLGVAFYGGHELSHGQWQRLALARAFFSKSKIMILDEPTASLDPVAELETLQGFLRVVQGRTAILIAHRLGWCRFVDRIYVLDKGRLVEEGTHHELLGQRGMYARLYEAQSQWYASAVDALPAS